MILINSLLVNKSFGLGSGKWGRLSFQTSDAIASEDAVVPTKPNIEWSQTIPSCLANFSSRAIDPTIEFSKHPPDNCRIFDVTSGVSKCKNSLAFSFIDCVDTSRDFIFNFFFLVKGQFGEFWTDDPASRENYPWLSLNVIRNTESFLANQYNTRARAWSIL